MSSTPDSTPPYLAEKPPLEKNALFNMYVSKLENSPPEAPS